MAKLSPKDIAGASRILREYWKTRGMSYSQEWTRNYLKQGHKTEIKKDMFFVAKDKNKVIGTMSIIIYEGDVAELRDFLVDNAYRGQGVGKSMMSELMQIIQKQKVRKIYALVFPDCGFYLKMGFKQEGLLKDHFVKGEDLAIVSKFL